MIIIDTETSCRVKLGFICKMQTDFSHTGTIKVQKGFLGNDHIVFLFGLISWAITGVLMHGLPSPEFAC